MSSIKTEYGTATSLTITNANLAVSATAGWKSAAIDNTSDKFLDALVEVELAAVNTAPAGLAALLLFAWGLVDSAAAAYSSSGDGTPDGSEGTITFPNVTTLAIPMPLLASIAYPTQNKAVNGGPYSVARAFGGILPAKWGLCMINQTGMTLSVTAVKYRGIFSSVT